MEFALERLADELAHPLRPALLVGVLGKLPVDHQRVERHAVDGGVDLRRGDVGAGRRAGPGQHREQPRMVGREHRDLGDRREGIGADGGADLLAPRLGFLDQPRMFELALVRHRDPVIVVVARHVGLEPFIVLDLARTGEFGLGAGYQIAPAHRHMAAVKHRRGGEIEGAQQLSLPAVPHPGPDRPDVGNGEDQQQPEPLQALHLCREVEDRLEIVEIPHLRRFAHHQMMTHQPCHRSRFPMR